MAHNTGYNIPSFGLQLTQSQISARSNQSHERIDDATEIDIEIGTKSHLSTHSGQSIKNTSHISHRGTSIQEAVPDIKVEPLHDPNGKPLRRHGTETFGDLLLHPVKEFYNHQKRMDAYKKEKEEWDEKHPESIASSDAKDYPDLEREVKIRLTIHFRHLVGEQLFKLSDEQIESLSKPLKLSEIEKLEFKKFNDTDDLIDFLEETKRNFSVKVHKTVKLRSGAAKDDLNQGSSSSSFDLIDKINNKSSDSSTSSSEKPKIKIQHQKVQKSNSAAHFDEDTRKKLYPHKTHAPTDLLMDLNTNVYIQIQFIEDVHHHEEKSRRAIFLVPDPDLSDEVDQHTSATWVELLGDVFYVGWLSQFTHSVEINSMQTLNIYAAWFVVMWWTWCSSALYSSRYDTQDVAHHIYKIVELCGLIIMAGSSEKTKFLSPKWFIIGYIIMKAVQLIEYFVIFVVSLGAHFKSSRRPLGMYVTANAISIALWGVSLLYTSPDDIHRRYALWYTSICLEVVVHVLLQGNSRVTLKASHLGERFGLFTLIILGENCMGFIKMVASNESTSSLIACNVFGVTIIFCYFFMYFDDFSGEFKNETKLSQLWMYLHFPLHLLQVAFGISLTQIIDRHSQDKDNVEGFKADLASCAALKEEAHGEHLKRAIYALAADAHGAESEGGCQDPVFPIKLFWITGGLILCVNAFIKLVNTPVNRENFRAYIICSSRVLNAVIFFALSTITYASLNGLGMVTIMMCCLLFQSGVDLLD